MAEISREEWLRRYGRENPRPQAAPIVGLPPPEERYSEAEIRDLLIEQGGLRELARGGVTAGSSLDRAAQRQAVEAELARAQALQMMKASPRLAAATLAELTGRNVAAVDAPAAAEFMALPGQKPLNAAQALYLAEQSGFSPVQSAALDPAAAAQNARNQQGLLRAAELMAQNGDIGPDLGAEMAGIAIAKGWVDPLSPDTGIEAQLSALPPERVAELNVLARMREGSRQMNAEETRLQAQTMGKGKTSGGRRNSFRKERGGSEEAAVLRAPGNVLSQGMEFAADDVLIPLLVAPRSQQRFMTGQAAGPYNSTGGPAMQVPQYLRPKQYRSNPDGPVSGADFSPSLRDARILYLNPYAELADEVVGALGLSQVPITATKDISGAYEDKAFNVPIPDVGQQQHGFEARLDPSYGLRSGQGFGDTDTTGGMRNPTLAEAVREISSATMAKVRPVTADMLVGGGQQASDILVNPETGAREQVFAMGNKRNRTYGADGAVTSNQAAPIADYMEAPQARDPRSNVLINPETGEWLRDASGNPLMEAPAVGDVRIGTPRRRSDEFYGRLDDLIDALAAQAYGRGGTEGGSGVVMELSTGDRYQPAAAQALPGAQGQPVVRYGSLLNLASTDPVVSTYQQLLLNEAGFPVRRTTGNPLYDIVGTLEALADAPPQDRAITQAALGAQAANEKLFGPGKVGAAGFLQQAKQKLVRGRSVDEPTTAFGRQQAEAAARQDLERLIAPVLAQQAEQQARWQQMKTPQRLRGELEQPLAAQQSRTAAPVQSLTDPAGGAVNVPAPQQAVQPALPGLQREMDQPQMTALDPVTRDLARYMAMQAPQTTQREPATVVQYAIPEIYNRFDPYAEKRSGMVGTTDPSEIDQILKERAWAEVQPKEEDTQYPPVAERRAPGPRQPRTADGRTYGPVTSEQLLARVLGRIRGR